MLPIYKFWFWNAVLSIVPWRTCIPLTYAVYWPADLVSATNCQVLSANIVVTADWRAPDAELSAVPFAVTTNCNSPLEIS